MKTIHPFNNVKTKNCNFLPTIWKRWKMLPGMAEIDARNPVRHNWRIQAGPN